MSKTPQRILRELSQPFKMNQLEWRVQQAGVTNNKAWVRVLAYVTSRDMQQRLDDVVGVFGWKNEFTTLPNSVGDGAMCGISLKFDGEWITKWNGSENTAIEAIKGGLSGAEKRAAVEWGIGRYLYDVEAMYADCLMEEDFKKLQYADKQAYEKAKTKDNQYVYWKPPTLDPKYRPQPYATKTIKDEIVKLCNETETDIKELLLLHIGVDSVHDLYQNETARVVDYLIKVKEKLQETEDGKDTNN